MDNGGELPALGSWQEQRWGLNLGLGCTCIHSLLCPITISQKPLDTGYKGLDVDVECPWPADLIVLSLQTPKFVCRQPLIGGFLTEILPDSCSCCVLLGIQSFKDPTWLGVAPDQDKPLGLCSSQAPGLDQCREGSTNLRGSVPPVFISV